MSYEQSSSVPSDFLSSFSKSLSSMIELRTITRDDWETCIDLKVARHQAHFVASNLYSLAQSRFLPGFRAVGIHHGGRMVGFALYGPDADDGHYWLYRLMIDRRYQGRGMARRPATDHRQRAPDEAAQRSPDGRLRRRQRRGSPALSGRRLRRTGPRALGRDDACLMLPEPSHRAGKVAGAPGGRAAHGVPA